MADRTKIWIAEALKRLLVQKSIGQVRVMEICQEAEVARATFYYHFEDKYDLMFYVRCCEELGIRDVMDGLARMFACDYVLANRDRHWRNFGVMRDVETLRGTRLAPIFDTGSCLWSDVPQLELPIDFKYTAKPFRYDGMRPYDQLCLFEGHLGWVSERALADFCDCVGDVLGANPNIAPARMDAIVRKVRELAADVVFVSHR